jgi:hypothetical protein
MDPKPAAESLNHTEHQAVLDAIAKANVDGDRDAITQAFIFAFSHLNPNALPYTIALAFSDALQYTVAQAQSKRNALRESKPNWQPNAQTHADKVAIAHAVAQSFPFRHAHIDPKAYRYTFGRAFVNAIRQAESNRNPDTQSKSDAFSHGDPIPSSHPYANDKAIPNTDADRFSEPLSKPNGEANSVTLTLSDSDRFSDVIPELNAQALTNPNPRTNSNSNRRSLTYRHALKRANTYYETEYPTDADTNSDELRPAITVAYADGYADGYSHAYAEADELARTAIANSQHNADLSSADTYAKFFRQASPTQSEQ